MSFKRTPSKARQNRRSTRRSTTTALNDRLASMSYEEAKAEGDSLSKQASDTGNTVRAFPRGSMGLVTDAVRLQPQYQTARLRSQAAFVKMQSFYKVFTKTFATEIRAEHARRGYGRK